MSSVVPQQDAIEVFINETGSISIVQVDGVHEQSVVVIHPANINALIRALRDTKKTMKEA